MLGSMVGPRNRDVTPFPTFSPGALAKLAGPSAWPGPTVP
jgi:hypothetical protein